MKYGSGLQHGHNDAMPAHGERDDAVPWWMSMHVVLNNITLFPPVVAVVHGRKFMARDFLIYFRVHCAAFDTAATAEAGPPSTMSTPPPLTACLKLHCDYFSTGESSNRIKVEVVEFVFPHIFRGSPMAEGGGGCSTGTHRSSTQR